MIVEIGILVTLLMIGGLMNGGKRVRDESDGDKTSLPSDVGRVVDSMDRSGKRNCRMTQTQEYCDGNRSVSVEDQRTVKIRRR